MSASLKDIIPFVLPLEALILDPTVTDIMVNEGGKKVFIERNGIIEETEITLTPFQLDPPHGPMIDPLLDVIQKIASLADDFVAEDQPLLETRLADGSRVSAVLPPVAVDGAILTIRKFGERFTLDTLVSRGSLPADVAQFLRGSIQGTRTTPPQNILISGGMGTGKTTLLNALAGEIPDRDRLLLIEDTSELLIKKPDMLRFEAQRKQVQIGREPPPGAVTFRDLVRSALRHRVDRIILGEVRGAEAWDLMESLNIGHPGSMSTIHANSALEALKRLSRFVLTAKMNLSLRHIREAIALAIQVVVHIHKVDGQRQVAEVLTVQDYDRQRDIFITTALYPAGRSLTFPVLAETYD